MEQQRSTKPKGGGSNPLAPTLIAEYNYTPLPIADALYGLEPFHFKETKWEYQHTKLPTGLMKIKIE